MLPDTRPSRPSTPETPDEKVAPVEMAVLVIPTGILARMLAKFSKLYSSTYHSELCFLGVAEVEEPQHSKHSTTRNSEHHILALALL